MERLSGGAQEPAGILYAASYHPIQRKDRSLDVWFEPLEIGGRLPDLPLFLRDGPCLKVAFEQTYNRVCRQLRLLQDLQRLKSLQPSDQHASA
jgi:hypothetical protein